MELYVKNSEYEQIAVIDSFVSLIWTKRYYNCGDFELMISAEAGLLDVLKKDYFLTREDDDSVMVIEKIVVQTDAENGNYFLISGRSLESILHRRIFIQQYYLHSTGTLAELVQALVTECTTNKDSTQAHPRTYRQIAGLTVDTSSSFSGEMDVQFTGDTLLNAIISVCQPSEVGIKMTLEGSTLLLSLYQGSESEAIFSPEFDNLVNSKYTEDNSQYANYAKILGEGEGSSRTGAEVLLFNPDVNPPTGLALHELYVDARNVSSNGGEINHYEYSRMLAQKGYDALSEHIVQKSFEAEVEPRMTYHYKTDYDLGDVVTVVNEYGVTANPRIIEIIESWDATGYKVIPTFDELEVL